MNSAINRVVTPVHFFVYILGILDIIILIVKPFIIEPEVQFFTIIMLISWLILFTIFFPLPLSIHFRNNFQLHARKEKYFRRILLLCFVALCLISLSISSFYGNINWIDPSLYNSEYNRYVNYQLALSSLVENTTSLDRLLPSLGNAVLFTASAYFIKILFSFDRILIGFLFYIPYAGFSYVRGTFFQLASLIVFSLIGYLTAHPLQIKPNILKFPKSTANKIILFIILFSFFVLLFYLNHMLRHVAGHEALDLTVENFALRREIIADIHNRLIPDKIMHAVLLSSVYITFPFMQFSRLILVAISSFDLNLLLFPLITHPSYFDHGSVNNFVTSIISSNDLLSVSPHVSILLTLMAFLGLPLAIIFLYPYLKLVFYAQRLSLRQPFGIIQVVCPLLTFSILCIYMNEFVFLPSVFPVFSFSVLFVLSILFKKSFYSR